MLTRGPYSVQCIGLLIKKESLTSTICDLHSDLTDPHMDWEALTVGSRK